MVTTADSLLAGSALDGDEELAAGALTFELWPQPAFKPSTSRPVIIEGQRDIFFS